MQNEQSYAHKPLLPIQLFRTQNNSTISVIETFFKVDVDCSEIKLRKAQYPLCSEWQLSKDSRLPHRKAGPSLRSEELLRVHSLPESQPLSTRAAPLSPPPPLPVPSQCLSCNTSCSNHAIRDRFLLLQIFPRSGAHDDT